MVRPWALAPIRRLVLVLLAVTASHHGHWAAASPTLCGGWWVSSHYSLYTTLYLLSKLTMRKVEGSHWPAARAELSLAARLTMRTVTL